MLDSDLRQRSTTVPPGHKLIAVIIAVAAGWGVYSWFSYKAMQSARTAELSFDAATARTIDPGLGDAKEPAVALAQSILDDQAVVGLSKQAYLASSAMNSRIGEFRSRLDLAQPSARVLDVRFHDADPARSQATANAIANALAAWKPSAATTTAPAGASQPAAPSAPPSTPAEAPPAAATNAPSVRRTVQPDHSLSDALGALEAELAATNRQLDRLSENSERTRSGRRPHSGSPSSYNESKQQQLLRAEVKTAQKKLDHLQVQYANYDPAAGIEARFAEIRQALASVWPASHAGTRGFNAAGVSASQLRRERAELSHVVAVVERERHAIQRAESAQGVSESDVAVPKSSPSGNGSTAGSAVPSPSASTSGSAAPTPATVPSQPTPSQAAVLPLKNPLQLARLALPVSPVSPWPAVAAGVLCGLLYLGAAKWRYRSAPYEDYLVENTVVSAPHPQRFITPDAPVQAADTSVTKADSSENRSEAAPAASSPRQRAFFTFDPAPLENAPSRLETAPSRSVLSEEDEQLSPGHAEKPLVASQERITLEECAIETGDPVADRIRKAFSEGSIRTLFEEAAIRNAEDTARADEDSPEHSAPPDRLAG